MRDKKMFESLVENLEKLFSHVEVTEVPKDWRIGNDGIVSEDAARQWYEGGYMLINIRN